MLEQIIGNTHTVQSLKKALCANKLSHSVMLCGEQGLGKGFAARCLAADYLYPHSQNGAKQVMQNSCPECIVIQGEGASGEIKVEAVRQMRMQIYSGSISAEGRVVIIKNAQCFKQSSANALLKVLEEPPPNVLFILTADSAAGILPTIRSRCSIYNLCPVPDAECEAWISTYTKDIKNIPQVSTVFAGHIGLCKACFDDAKKMQQLQNAVGGIKCIKYRDTYGLLKLFAQVEKDKAQATGFLQLLQNALHAAIVRQSSGLFDISANQALGAIEQISKTLVILNTTNTSVKLALVALSSKL